ncbi:hypothetical protein DWX10_20715 [Clostridium sp. AF18-27]|uniref:XkdQ/YqbQ family protein n=1 Tax=Enterocloster lavalensis TaxID=460384 RepID=UPI000E4C8CA2|nr:hypothetical protein [Enterocloster lavalensis]RHR49615.1 hypothetical protein DWX10_20715 [Clostridium sp. AF18-27]
MEYKLLVYNIASQSVYDYAPITEKVTYTTNRKLSAGELNFTYIQKVPVNMAEGAKVQFYVNGRGIFEGYVFTIEQDRQGIVEVTAYDQLRYLKTNESYAFIGKTLGEIIQQIATDMQLQTGTLENTGYVIPMLTKEDTQCLDIIDYALGLTQYNTGKTYSLFDDFGKISLREAGSLLCAEIIGNRSLLTDYTFKSDIDSDTYNQIKLVRPNKETGQGDVYIFNDSSTIGKWGLLQKYEKVDENLNEAQISEQGNIMMAYYDRVLKDVSVDCIGIPGLRAGGMVTLKIRDIPELRSGYRLLLDKVKHKFSNGEHTMSFEARMLNL